MPDDTRNGRPPEAGESGEAPSGANAAEDKAAETAAEQKVAELEAALRAKSEEAAANFDRYLRALAEGENSKKRMQREKAEAIRLANEALLRDLLPILDNLERAIEHAKLGGNGKSVAEGVELTLRLFRDVLERHGVTEIAAPAGTVFDPSIHDAAGTEPTSEHPTNTVIRQAERGYLLRDRLLRPVKVVVAAAPERSPGESDES